MTATLHHPSTPTVHDSDSARPTRRGARWPIAGIIAGVTGLAASMAAIADLTEEQYASGVDVIDHLERGGYHIGFILGLISVAALLVTAAGWRRWAARRAGDDLAPGIIAAGLTATATVNLIGFSLMGSMALYLPGGMDEGWISREAIFTNFNYLDFGTLFGWWTTLFAAGVVATLAFRRNRLLPRWMGVISVVFMLPAIAFAVTAALPGFPGLVMPLWLIVISVGMIFSRTAEA